MLAHVKLKHHYAVGLSLTSSGLILNSYNNHFFTNFLMQDLTILQYQLPKSKVYHLIFITEEHREACVWGGIYMHVQCER